MKFIDWFAGIGGFRLGLERAGMQCAYLRPVTVHLKTPKLRKYQ